MKKIILLLVLTITNLIFAQGKVNFEAEILNSNYDTLRILDISKAPNITVRKTIIGEKGVFKDSLNNIKGMYALNFEKGMIPIYLNNGYDLKLKADFNNFIGSLNYTGIGAEQNNVSTKIIFSEMIGYDENNLNKNEEEYLKIIDDIKAKNKSLLENEKFEADFIKYEQEFIEQSFQRLKHNYTEQNNYKKLNNSKAPNFDYENHAGGKTSLESLKGKYVYIDVWATWCGPCRQEIPFLQKAEEKFHDKNIVFVSISVDVEKDHEKWKKFVTDKNLGGIQLIADNNWNSDFIKAFGINSIPRFILIDPNGNVVDADAQRPSSTELTALLEGLLK